VTGCYFLADDFLHLYQIANDGPAAFIITPHGGHLYVTRNAVFYATTLLFGPRPQFFYWTGFLLHLCNVYLLARTTYLLTASYSLALFAASLWGSSPCALSTLGWYSTFGNELVTAALLIILRDAMASVAGNGEPTPIRRTIWCTLALVGATSWGTGIGLALALPAALWMLGVRCRSRFGPMPLVSLLAVVPMLYVVLNWVYRMSSDAPMFGSSLTSLLAQAHGATILRYLGLLIALGLTRLVLGFAFVPSLNVWAWYSVCAVLILALLAVAGSGPRRVRGQIGALTVLLVGCYGAIAVGRGGIFANLSPEVFVGASYYHYSGQVLLTLLLCVVLARLPGFPAWAGRTGLVASYGLLLVLWLGFAPPIDQHDSARRETEATLGAIRERIDAEPRGHAVYIENRVFEPLPFPQQMFPGWAGVFIIFHPENTVDGRPVYFVERSSTIPTHLSYGRRTGTLIVPAFREG
jgi:hypothetical protein